MPKPPTPADQNAAQDPAEGSRSVIDRELKRKETQGQFARTRKGAKNNGMSSAEPRSISGDEKGDATFPLKQDKGR